MQYGGENPKPRSRKARSCTVGKKFEQRFPEGQGKGGVIVFIEMHAVLSMGFDYHAVITVAGIMILVCGTLFTLDGLIPRRRPTHY